MSNWQSGCQAVQYKFKIAGSYDPLTKTIESESLIPQMIWMVGQGMPGTYVKVDVKLKCWFKKQKELEELTSLPF